jgi:hypothetical protein
VLEAIELEEVDDAEDDSDDDADDEADDDADDEVVDEAVELDEELDDDALSFIFGSAGGGGALSSLAGGGGGALSSLAGGAGGLAVSFTPPEEVEVDAVAEELEEEDALWSIGGGGAL